MTLLEICGLFQTNGNPYEVTYLHNSVLRDTYQVNCGFENDTTRYILQKLKPEFLKDVEKSMQNSRKIFSHLTSEFTRMDKNIPENLHFINTKCGLDYLLIDDGAFRMIPYIDECKTYRVVKSYAQFVEMLGLIGNFTKMMSNFPVDSITSFYPFAHNGEKAYALLLNALKKDSFNRAQDIREEIAWIKKRERFLSRLVSLLRSDVIPTRVTLNDLDVRNFLFDKKTGKGCAILNYDRAERGTLLYDFGDAIRVGCNLATESEEDLSQVVFDENRFKLFTKSFLIEMGDYITLVEKQNLVLSAYIMTIERGVLRLTDYLKGDAGFDPKFYGNNLNAARNNFKLAGQIEKIQYDLADWVSQQ